MTSSETLIGTRPNVLIIMSDEHGARYSGSYGHSIVQTPNLDRLSEEGTVYDNAYCNSPICGPSRAAFLTAQYPSAEDCFDLASQLRSDAATYAHAVRSVGYDAALAGKQHFVGPDQLHGFRVQLSSDVHANDTPLIPWPDDLPRKDASWPYPLQAGPGHSEIIETDDQTERAAVEYLSQQERSDQPWLLCASFVAPHWPYLCPSHYLALYQDRELDLPQINTADLERQHPVIRRLRARLGVNGYPREAQLRARAAYYGMITQLDGRVGRLCELLARRGLYENTVVIYTSDHGGMLGEHGLWRKMNFYEDSVRVPLIVRWPGKIAAGARIQTNVSLVDVGASIAACTGSEFPTPVRGKNIFQIGDKESLGTGEVFSEYLAHGIARPMAMLKSGTYKFNYYHGERAELFDLSNDPEEQSDLIDNPDFTAVKDTMLARILELWDPDSIEERVLRSQKERLFIRAVMNEDSPTSEVSP